MNCPDNFTQFEERCYKYIPTLATWHEARVTCLEDYDADLISLDRQSIFDHVRANFGGGNQGSLLYGDDSVMDYKKLFTGQSFVGATDVSQEGTFVWTNGVLVTGGWLYGEPNYLGIENCVVIIEEGLNNIECELSRAFICEKRDCPPGYSLFEGYCIKCPASYIRFENKCYRYYQTKVTWYEARQTCRGVGDDLVSLNENAVFDHIVTFTMAKDTDVHVGANDLAEEGVFVWSNGEPVTDGWSGGEPNDEAYWGGEDCVSLSPWQGLIDIPCSINFGTVAFICERNVAILSTTTSSTTAVHSTFGHSNTTSSGPAVTFSMTNHSNLMTETTTTPIIINRTNKTIEDTMTTPSMTNGLNKTTEETITTPSMTNGLNKTTKWTIATLSLTSLTNKTTKATITTPVISAFLNITKREQFVSPSLSIAPSTQKIPENNTATTDGSNASASASNTSSTAESETHSIDTARSTATPNVSDDFTNATRAKLTSPNTTAESTVDASTSVPNIENTTTIRTVTTNITNTNARTPLMMTTTTTVVSTTATAYTTLAAKTATAFTILAPTTTAEFTNTSHSGPLTGDANGGDSKLLLGLVLSAAVLSVILAAVSVWMILKFLNNTSHHANISV